MDAIPSPWLGGERDGQREASIQEPEPYAAGGAGVEMQAPRRAGGGCRSACPLFAAVSHYCQCTGYLSRDADLDFASSSYLVILQHPSTYLLI